MPLIIKKVVKFQKANIILFIIMKLIQKLFHSLTKNLLGHLESFNILENTSKYNEKESLKDSGKTLGGQKKNSSSLIIIKKK